MKDNNQKSWQIDRIKRFTELFIMKARLHWFSNLSFLNLMAPLQYLCLLQRKWPLPWLQCLRQTFFSLVKALIASPSIFFKYAHTSPAFNLCLGFLSAVGFSNCFPLERSAFFFGTLKLFTTMPPCIAPTAPIPPFFGESTLGWSNNGDNRFDACFGARSLGSDWTALYFGIRCLLVGHLGIYFLRHWFIAIAVHFFCHRIIVHRWITIYFDKWGYAIGCFRQSCRLHFFLDWMRLPVHAEKY